MNADDCTRVYAPTGKLAHLLPPGNRPSVGYPAALCRMRPRLFRSWLGTGSQAEYETAAALPTCTRCAESLKPEPTETTTEGVAR